MTAVYRGKSDDIPPGCFFELKNNIAHAILQYPAPGLVSLKANIDSSKQNVRE
jgi:hypothetical protein